jgi:exodeoxyribonuclease V alpha subunit
MTEQSNLFGRRGGRRGGAGAASTVSVEGEVGRIVFSNPDNGWTVLRFVVDGERITATGPMYGVREGETLRLSGEWSVHPKFGRQLDVESFLPVEPSTLDGVRRYLGSGLVPGIGEAFAGRLVAHFGDRTLDVIQNHPHRLAEVPGIGPKRVARIRSAWDEHHAARDVLVFLQSHGVSPAYAMRIHRRYGTRSMSVIRENPYRLASDVAGIGFRRADDIARSCGIDVDHPLRARAGLLYTLRLEADDGHTCAVRGDLLDRAARTLEIGGGQLARACDEMVDAGKLVATEQQVALAQLDEAEQECAGAIARIARPPAPCPAPPTPAEMADAERRCGIELEAIQREAVQQMLVSPLAVLTGGPGTGKTTCLRVLLDLLDRRGAEVLQAAPTGRAARRMSEATGHGASTLHRLLAFSPRDGAFHRNADHPLRADAVIVDEVSMVDVLLLRALLDAVAEPTRLLLVGDADQLPSVGPGQVLADLIHSGRVPVVRLRRVFRQAETSGIVTAAHQVLSGTWPTSGESPTDDFFFFRRDDPRDAARTVRDLVSRRIPEGFGLDPMRDVQVLTPMHRGECGSLALNMALQESLNPPHPDRPQIVRGSRTYRTGDRVMQVRNDYDREVFNGELGVIEQIDMDQGRLTVSIDGRPLEYAREELDAVVPAYAVSIHKSQGSEYPAVVIPLCGEHWVMLRRNLLYTAVTRGERLVAIVGNQRALGRCLSNRDMRTRQTSLKKYLGEAMDQTRG